MLVSGRVHFSLEIGILLLMAEILHHLGCMKPYKQWEKLPTSTGAGFQPSTVSLGPGNFFH